MLQQTQVATVIDYYQRFLKSFPDVRALAEADPQLLLSHWEGLGYYRRARSLHAAARQIVEKHDGVFPETFDEVIALPGVGRYTAGAILSISGDKRLPILEGNTQRVFSRWIALGSPAVDRASTKLLWQVADEMLPVKRAGVFNQAAMELGALVCSPTAPDCDHCPVSQDCRARQAGLQEVIPGKVSRVNYEDRTEYAIVIAQPPEELATEVRTSEERAREDRDGAPISARTRSARTRSARPRSARPRVARYLVRQLPEGRRWAGLWDFPRTTEQTFSSVEAAADGLSSEVVVSFSIGPRIATIRHGVTRYRIELHVHEGCWTDPALTPPRPWRFVSLKQLEKLPMSVTGRKIASLLQRQIDS
jgi:A/G-specific adenine glycosylase